MQDSIYFELKNPPLERLVKSYDREMPTLDGLQDISIEFPHAFKREDWPAAAGPDGGPFRIAMGMAIQKYLGLNPYEFTELRQSRKEPKYRLMDDSGDELLTPWDKFVERCRDHFFAVQSYCKTSDERDIESAADDVEIAFGHQLEKEEDPRSEHLAIASKVYLQKKGCDAYPVGDTTYHELLLRWWRQNPHTVFRAYRSKNYVGVAVLLPVARDAFEALKRGDAAIGEIEPVDILRKSKYFFLEAAFDRPLISEKERLRTRALRATLLAQLAYAAPIGQETNLRGLSFNACHTSKTRLVRGGFKPLPETLKGTNFPLMEFGPATSRMQKRALAFAIKQSRESNRRLFAAWETE